MVVIVDYGMGNLNSIKNMLKKIGHSSIISSEVEEIEKAGKVILPGVGSFDAAMMNIKRRNLFDVLNYKASDEKVPLLGICLGMQLLTNSSEEGEEKGFGWINADTIKFENKNGEILKVPHMGWNRIKFDPSSLLFQGLDEATKFYFVHSYYVKCHSQKNSLAKTQYGLDFDSIINNDNIYGTQFHPEKSHKYGMQLLKNFMNL
ncbi:MAG: imidazole glycerol phosphate synthase subunit HisH [Bacteroidota bacterium]